MSLVLQEITKHFGPLRVLVEVTAAFRPGTIHGLLGENGAGKTTLMRIAVGLLRPDGGSIRVSDGALIPGSPRGAARAGIAMVHQHFMLVPTLTVAENCLLGRREVGQWISRRGVGQGIRTLARRLGFDVDPDARIENLSVGEQQRVEIVRALMVARRVLILDEPTAVLTPGEVDQLFAALDQLRQEGLSVVFISHKLGEVQRICDELTILRRGRVVHAGPAAELTPTQMAELMVGPTVRVPSASEGADASEWAGYEAAAKPARARRKETGEMHSPLPAKPPPRPSPGVPGEGDGAPSASESFRVPSASEGETAAGDAAKPAALELCSISGRDARSHRHIEDVNLVLRCGEILGVAGVEGNGQDVLAGVLVGTLHPSEGRILLDGRDVTAWSVRARAAAGLAHISEDRLGQALVPHMPLTENLILKSYRQPAFARLGLLRPRAIRTHATELLARFDVRADSPASSARSLSGGNQQKLVLARELSGEPRLIVAHNPVRGLDVAATQFVFERLLEQRRRGTAVLLIHSDLDELLSVSDRVAVLYNGRLTLTDWPTTDRAVIGQMMLGGAPHDAVASRP
jgi:simple sugar transport system ATP-binding protein